MSVPRWTPSTSTASVPWFRFERHALGPRLHLGGHRLHEWHIGALLLLLGLAAALAGIGRPIHLAAFLAVLGAYLVAKDWRDLSHATRDTGAWRLGLHRPPLALRPRAGPGTGCPRPPAG